MLGRKFVAVLSLSSMLLLQIHTSGVLTAVEALSLSIPEAEAACTGTASVQLGAASPTPQTADSQTDQFGNGITRQAGGTFNCPAGQVVTSIAYLGIQAGNDSTDGLTIACSPLNSNGTLGSQSAYMSNSDFNNNPRYPSDLVQPICSSGNAVVSVYFNDIINTGREDAMDGIGIGCNQISTTGVGAAELDTRTPSDITHHGTPLQKLSCPSGTVAVGVTYDSFGNTLPADPDATDSVVRLNCAPINVTCTTTQCSDGIDNDGDGATDLADFSCSGATDNDELNPKAQCQDGIDNDGDGLTDYPQDPGCTSKQDNDEYNAPTPQCSDGLDNDGDGATDLADFSCSGNPNDNDELNPKAQCQDGIDNDGDGLTDYPQDPGCSSRQDNDEFNTTQCSDGIDNDGDGATDLGDFSCSSTTDNDELNPKAQCQDGIDNDGDGKIDYPQDPGCTSKQDNDEFNQTFADLMIIKNGVTQIERGSILTYTLHVTNNGPNTALGTTVTDIIPAGLGYLDAQSDSRCNQVGNSVSCTLGTIANQVTTPVVVSFQSSAQTACGMLTNTASVTSTVTDSDTGNNQSSLQTQLTCPQPTFELTKTDGRTSVNPGETLTYTVTVRNTSQTNATGITVTDTLPTGVTFVNASNGGTLANGIVTWSNLSIAAGVMVNMTVQVTVNANAAIGSTLTNTARLGTLTATDTTTVQAAPKGKLEVEKTGPATASAGGQVTYSFAVQNIGNATVANAVAYDFYIDNANQQKINMPLTYVSASGATCSYIPASNHVQCSLGDILLGQTKTFTMTFSIPANQFCGQVLMNQVDVGPTISDVDATDWDKHQVTVQCPQPQSDLSISKTGDGSSQPGAVEVFWIEVSNNGPDTAQGVTVTDTIPAGLSFNAAGSDASCISNGTTVTCGTYTLTSGQKKTVTIAFTVSPSATCNSIYTNAATVSSTTTDPQSYNNTSSQSMTVQCPQPKADLEIIKSGSPQITRSTTLLYTLTVKNLGPDTATNVTVADPIPANLTFNSGASDPACVQNGVNILCNNFQLTSGTTRTLVLAFNVPSMIACNAVITNQASVSTSATDPNPGNNQSQVVYTSVTCPPATLELTKTDGKTTVAPGETSTYTITIKNTSDVNSTAQTVIDTLPPSVTFVSASSNGAHSNGIVTWGNVTVPANQSVNLTVQVQVAPNAANGTVLTNNVQVGTLVAIDTTTVSVSPATFSVTKTDNKTTAAPGDTLPYLITVKNTSTVNATNATLTDTLPAGVTFVSANNSGMHSNGVVTWTGINLAAGLELTFAVNVTINQSVTNGTVLKNIATIGGATGEDTTTVNVPVATLVLSKTDGRATVAPGDTLTYTISLQNTSAVQATGVTVTDTLPTGLTFVSASTGGTNANGTVTWTNVIVPANQSVNLTVQATVGQTVANGTVLTNTAKAGTLTATDQTTVSVPTPTFTITKTDGKTSALPGETLNYVITVVNTSQVNATGITVSDVLPTGVTFVSASTGSAVVSGTVQWTNQTFTAGQSKSFTVNVTVNQNAAASTILTNTATVGTMTAQDTTTVGAAGQPTFTVSKTDNRATATPGETLNYVITVLNTSQVNATNVTLTDTLPSNVTFVSTSDNGIRNGVTVTWTGISIPAGGSITRTVSVTVNQGTSNGTVINNTASVGGVIGTDTTTVSTGQASVTIDITDSKDPVAPDATFIYTIRVTNVTGVQANNLTVTQTLDGDTEYQASSSAGSHSNGTVTWTGVNVPANGSVTLTSTVQVRSTADDGDILNSTASTGTVSDQETTRVEDDDDDDEEDLSISVRDDRDPVRPGETFRYILTVRNNSDERIETDVIGFLDDDTTFLDASDDGDEEGDDRVRWKDIEIDEDESVTLEVTVRVSSSADDGQNLRFRARAGDEEDTELTRVEDDDLDRPGSASITIDKRADRQEAQPGSVVSYTVTLRNGSSHAVEDLTVEDIFSAGTFTVEDAGGGSINGNGITWNIPSLGANATRVITYRVRLSSTMRHGQTVSNTVTVRTRNAGTATDTEQVRIIQNLPQTGLGGFLSAGAGSNTLRPRIATPHIPAPSATVPFIVWTNIIALGISGGGLLGRKLWF